VGGEAIVNDHGGARHREAAWRILAERLGELATDLRGMARDIQAA
jgi:hypothetical protein